MSFSRFLALSLCAATASRAQTPAAPAAHSHTPAAPSHAHGVVTLDQFVTSAAPFARNQVDLAQSTTVLGDRALLLKQQATLGETLATETGMNATSFGPGASRPIIRGLGGDRIRLLENSVGTLDASVTSPDHAVSIEPMLVERIEVVRGPASLLYGASAVGGVVNVITHRIETDLPTEPMRGALEVRGSTAADELARGGIFDFAVKPRPDRALVFHVDAFRREADDLRIPGFAESAALRAEETAHARAAGEPPPAFARDRLPNSALASTSAAGGVSYVTDAFHFGAAYSGLDSNYGVPAHAHDAAPGEGVRIDLRQRRTDLQGEWHADAGAIRGARFKFGHSRYRHAEIEPDGEIGTVFTNRGHDARFELLHGDGKPWTGALGAQATRADFAAAGEEAFLPSSRSDAAAVFAFEEIETHPVTWQLGARYERTKLSTPDVRPRRDDGVSGSAGAVWQLDPRHTFTVSVARTVRAPNNQELLAAGPHVGTQSYEIGDARLGRERSLGLEASLRQRRGFVTGAVTLFANRFSGYIFPLRTPEIAVAGAPGWEVLSAAAAPADGDAESLPVYRYVQRDARFWGAELETVWHLHEAAGTQLDLRLAADLTRARSAGENLPRIPPARVTGGLAWARGHWSAGAEAQRVFAQDRVAPGESRSGGYTLVSAHVARALTLGHFRAELFARGTNLADVEVRPHASFVKDLAPLAGRSLTAGLRLSF